MHVIRVQTADGTGPFYARHSEGGSIADAYDRAQTYAEYHSAHDMPTPYASAEYGSPLYKLACGADGVSGRLFGFTDFTQFQDAFPCVNGRKAMKDAGARLVVYSVPPAHVVEGKHQCVFVKKKAKMIQTLDLVTLDEIPCESLSDTIEH